MDKLFISSKFPVLAQPHLSPPQALQPRLGRFRLGDLAALAAVQLAIEVALTAAGIGHVLKIGSRAEDLKNCDKFKILY